jgi:hypothetical protein
VDPPPDAWRHGARDRPAREGAQVDDPPGGARRRQGGPGGPPGGVLEDHLRGGGDGADACQGGGTRGELRWTLVDGPTVAAQWACMALPGCP